MTYIACVDGHLIPGLNKDADTKKTVKSVYSGTQRDKKIDLVLYDSATTDFNYIISKIDESIIFESFFNLIDYLN